MGIEGWGNPNWGLNKSLLPAVWRRSPFFFFFRLTSIGSQSGSFTWPIVGSLCGLCTKGNNLYAFSSFIMNEFLPLVIFLNVYHTEHAGSRIVMSSLEYSYSDPH